MKLNAYLLKSAVVAAAGCARDWSSLVFFRIPAGDDRDELHFDHVLPFSKGGTSLTARNVQLLSAGTTLRKVRRSSKLLAVKFSLAVPNRPGAS